MSPEADGSPGGPVRGLNLGERFVSQGHRIFAAKWAAQAKTAVRLRASNSLDSFGCK